MLKIKLYEFFKSKMSGKKKKKGEFTYVGVSPKNWREKVREINKKAEEYIKKHGDGATLKSNREKAKSVGNPNPMFKSVSTKREKIVWNNNKERREIEKKKRMRVMLK